MNDQARTYAAIIGVLVLITGGLLYIDLQNEAGEGSPGFFSSVLRGWVRSGSISSEILEQTSMAGASILSEESTASFFEPYLSLPENLLAQRYNIESTSISIYEVSSQDPKELINQLLDQPSQHYRFNTINEETFYLNQIPADTKTHNYLAIANGQSVFGFVYKPADHRKVLEIIDVLEKNQ